MALGNVIIKDVDGNIPYAPPSDQEKVTGLLFDTSLQPNLFATGYGKNNEGKLRQNDVIYVTSRKSSVTDFGIIERVDVPNPDEENNENFMHGIPAYHIREFFRMSGNVDGPGKLYVMFADCSTDWDAVDVMQRVAGGQINQLGIWTEQPLWKLNGDADLYNLNLVKSVHDKAEAMAAQNQPLSIVLSANPSNTGAMTSAGKQIDLLKIPTAICESSRVTVIFGQAANEKNRTMQMRNANNTPVGFLGDRTGQRAGVGCVGTSVQPLCRRLPKHRIWVRRYQPRRRRRVCEPEYVRVHLAGHPR